jgi:hypothetical protein
MNKLILFATLALVACSNAGESSSDPKKQDRSGLDNIIKNYDANVPANWKLIDRQFEHANNSAEFQKLQQKYPAELNPINPAEISQADVANSFYKYVGHTICEIGDPRLTWHAFHYEACRVSRTEQACYSSVIAIPNGQDPCRSPDDHREVVVTGRGDTCALAKADGQHRCELGGYTKATFKPDLDGDFDGCTVQGLHYATFICSND